MTTKVRAWDEANKIMHYDFQSIRSGNDSNDWVVFISNKQKLTDEQHPFDNPYFANQLKRMQFTGLIDKNGKEVYEGDVVQACFVWGCIGGVVKYFDWLAAFGVEVNNGRYLFSEHSPNIWEVLGNVWENPELLEGEDEE